jgi:hypothetical protein
MRETQRNPQHSPRQRTTFGLGALNRVLSFLSCYTSKKTPPKKKPKKKKKGCPSLPTPVVLFQLSRRMTGEEKEVGHLPRHISKSVSPERRKPSCVLKGLLNIPGQEHGCTGDSGWPNGWFGFPSPPLLPLPPGVGARLLVFLKLRRLPTLSSGNQRPESSRTSRVRHSVWFWPRPTAPRQLTSHSVQPVRESIQQRVRHS